MNRSDTSEYWNPEVRKEGNPSQWYQHKDTGEIVNVFNKSEASEALKCSSDKLKQIKKPK